MNTCLLCKKTFVTVKPESSKLYHANAIGYCSEKCEFTWGKNYDRQLHDPLGMHINPDRILTHD